MRPIEKGMRVISGLQYPAWITVNIAIVDIMSSLM